MTSIKIFRPWILEPNYYARLSHTIISKYFLCKNSHSTLVYVNGRISIVETAKDPRRSRVLIHLEINIRSSGAKPRFVLHAALIEVS